MAGEERERRHLHERLEQALGTEAADRLLEGMAMLERDQRTTAEALDLLRADMELGFAELRGEISELRGEMGELRGEMTTGFERSRADLFQLLHEQRQQAENQFRTLLFAMLGTVLTVAAMAFGAASI